MKLYREFSIWKYPLRFQPAQFVDMPAGARVLSVQYNPRDGAVCAWALVDPTAALAPVFVTMIGTGDMAIGSGPFPHRHVGTVILADGTVWHYFVGGDA